MSAVAPTPPLPEATASEATALPESGYAAVERLYHALLTGLILALVSRCGAEVAAEVVFRLFRTQQQALFLPGLAKLGLTGLPDAVACARYHYLSNAMGGVKVEYMEESPRKAWVRYPPPRWIFAGTAVCGVPSGVSAAMLRGWHANNGVSLGNPRLGFVCTGQTVDGDPGLEGYYLEHDRDLAPEERLRFAPEEQAPPFDPDAAPQPPAADWPPARLRKAMRNYTMAYIRSILPATMAVLGEENGPAVAGHAARLIGMHHYDETAALLGITGDDAAAFASYLQRLATAQGDTATVSALSGGAVEVRQQGWRLMAGTEASPGVFAAWNALWEGALAVHNRHLRLAVHTAPDMDAPVAADCEIRWRIVP